MKKIFITGATDGIGLHTAQKLKSLGHNILAHGRSAEKLAKLHDELGVETYRADLSKLAEVKALAAEVAKNHSHLDILINNAGVFKTSNPVAENGLDVRLVVNTIAPYCLTKQLLPMLGVKSRVINLSSAAQAPVDLEALRGNIGLDDFEAYAQSKLAIVMWSQHLAQELKSEGPVVIAVNPGSLLGTKMVTEGFGTAGKDIGVGADILTRLALDEEFQESSGLYFDNDSGEFSAPHADASDVVKTQAVVDAIEEILNH